MLGSQVPGIPGGLAPREGVSREKNGLGRPRRGHAALIGGGKVGRGDSKSRDAAP